MDQPENNVIYVDFKGLQVNDEIEIPGQEGLYKVLSIKEDGLVEVELINDHQ